MPFVVNPDHGYLEYRTSAGSIGALTNINVDFSSGAGTDPVVPDSNDEITMTAAQVASGTTSNAIRVASVAANTVTLQIQQTGTSASKDTSLNGIAHFNSAQFTVDEGFVSITDSSNTSTGQTVGAVTADVITITPTDLKGFVVQALVIGYESTGPGIIGGELIATGSKDGTVSIVGTAIKSRNSSAALAAGDFNCVASGADFVLQVLGVAGVTIDWRVSIINYESP